MSGKTVEDLRAARRLLDEQLTHAAYALTNGINQRAIERLVQLNEAIYALDTVIEEGREEPQV